MFDATGAFKKQFTPVDGGYVYYPSHKTGGKLVTVEEYDSLVADWQRIAGTRGRWKAVGLVFLAILIWSLASEALALPEWSSGFLAITSVAGFSGWLGWAAFAPRRLVRGRPDIVPSRPASEARRQTRTTLNWQFVIFALLFSGTVLVGTLSSSSRSLVWWAWLIGSAAFFGGYLWIAVLKLRDRKG